MVVQIQVFLTSALIEVTGQLHVRTLFIPVENPRYPLDQRLDEPPSENLNYAEKKRIMNPSGTRTPKAVFSLSIVYKVPI
jgi:hypothetical protein